MAGKVRHLLERSGRYYARISIPESLRPIVGKRELSEALGGDRQLALRALPAAVTRLQAILNSAQAQAASVETTRQPRRNRPLNLPQLARAHYDAELQIDDAARTGPVTADYDPVDYSRLFADGFRLALQRVAAGRATDDEIRATIGWALDGFAARGNP